MNTKNMILTSTVGMERSQWLEFRKPLSHVTKLVSDVLGRPRELWTYEELVKFFSSEQWKDFQFPVVGASEVAGVIGLSPYKSVIELFYEKVGIKETSDLDNAAMFWGRELEAEVAEKWQYWEGSPESLIQNFNAGNLVRRCRRVNSYIQNKSFPWIMCSLDRVINKTKTVVLSPDEIKDPAEGSLECKTISGFASNMWENGIPPMYVAQLQTQIAVCEFSHGEIAILKDGRYFEVFPFDKSEPIIQRILKDTEKFFNTVKLGLEHFVLAGAATEEMKLHHFNEIDRIAPEPDGSVSYRDYLSEKYNDNGFEVTGGLLELSLAKDYKYFGGQIKDLETLQMERSNRLKAFMKDASKVSFGPDGYVSWKQGTKSRTFRVEVKLEEDFIPDIIKTGQ